MRIIAIKGLNVNQDVNKSKKEYRQQERELNGYIRNIPRVVEQMFSKGKSIYTEIENQMPGRQTDSLFRQRRSAWMQRAGEIDGLKEFCSHISDVDSEKKVIRLLCDMVSGKMLLRDGKQRLITWATKFFKNTATGEKQNTNFQDSGYEKSFLDFLPPQVYFELGPNRELIEIKESFGRQIKNWEIMSKKISYIAKNYNEMVRDVKKDLNSGNEVTKLLALMMAITIETVLRPGAMGNAAKVKDEVTGEKVDVETFGVTTLQVQHIKNIRDGFAELQFPGKKATEQIAQLTDADIVSALKSILATTSLQGDSAMLFVTKDGQHINDSQLRKYAKEKWGAITPTDFRKFAATKSFYNQIKQQTEDFRLKLIDEITKDQELLKQTIINGIINIINNALEPTKQVLNHKEGNDAWKSYISPKIILAYLSNGGLENTLEEILIDNKNVKFNFDFRSFIKFADNI